MNQKFWIVFLAAILLIVRCSGFSNSRASDPASNQIPSKTSGTSVSIADNRSKIVGALIEAVPHERSKFFLRIQIEEVASIPDYSSFAKNGEKIEVYPNFIRREGQAIDYSMPENEKMLQAGKLKPGEKISAIVYLKGDEQKRTWLMMSWDYK